MKNKNYKQNEKKCFLTLIVITLFVILSLSLTSATYIKSNFNFGQFDGATGTVPDKELCQAGQDFVIQIAPFGCTPTVVRSDLLEEQNVPVFCQLAATKINPLVDVKIIDSISFKGKYHKEV